MKIVLDTNCLVNVIRHPVIVWSSAIYKEVTNVTDRERLLP